MLSIGLRTDTTIVADLKQQWRLILRALAVVWLGVPALVILAVRAFQVPPIGTTTLLLMALCPGIPLLVRSAEQAGGSSRTALLVLLATALTAPVMVPLWAEIHAQSSRVVFVVDAVTVLKVVIPSVILPYVMGRIISYLVSKRAAVMLAKLATIVFVAGFAITLVVLVIKAIPVLTASSPQVFVALIISTLAAAALGYAVGGPRAPDRIALGYAAALGNPALALAIAARTAPDTAFLPLVGAYVLVRTLTLIPFGRWIRRRAHEIDVTHGCGAPAARE
jgi:BASS family bile acid:Na+ symporter